jgi:hypothetical protein
MPYALAKARNPWILVFAILLMAAAFLVVAVLTGSHEMAAGSLQHLAAGKSPAVHYHD